MANVKVEDLHVNPKTGLVACRFLGAKEGPKGDEVRVGEAGLGLRAGEVRGFEPERAAYLINHGWAELIPVKEVVAAHKADEASRVAAAERDALAGAIAVKAVPSIAAAGGDSGTGK